MKYIPLASLKNTTGIVTFCKEANELVVANRNGLSKLDLMSREVYENGFGKVMENQVVPVLRNGVDEIYVMDYEAYRMRKDCLMALKKMQITMETKEFSCYKI